MGVRVGVRVGVLVTNGVGVRVSAESENLVTNPSSKEMYSPRYANSVGKLSLKV